MRKAARNDPAGFRELRYCACGCGEAIPERPGKGAPRKWLPGHARKHSVGPRWRVPRTFVVRDRAAVPLPVELVDVHARLRAAFPDGFTREEACAVLGLTSSRTWYRLLRLEEVGHLKRVWFSKSRRVWVWTHAQKNVAARIPPNRAMA